MAENQLALTNEKSLEIARSIDTVVNSVLASTGLGVFEQTFINASAIAQIEELLTDEYMDPIMKLQGKSIGFRTDEDKNKGYAKATVKRCLIEAMFMGLQPIGNQFNIIGGKTYPTKEGFSHLLRTRINKLWFDIVQNIPKTEGKQSVVDTRVIWKLGGGEKQERLIELPIKVNEGMGSDAILGKAERKAKKWLYNHITGNNLSDGDIDDLEPRVVYQAKKPSNNDHYDEAIIDNTDEAVTSPEEVKVKTELQIKAENFFRATTDINTIDQRWEKAKKNDPDIDKKIYDEVKALLTVTE